MQLSTEPAMRGRVMALRLGVALGGTPIGAPIVGWVADHLGPRSGLGVGAAAGFAAAVRLGCRGPLGERAIIGIGPGQAEVGQPQQSRG